jgi:hypothetical protein
VPEIGRTDPTLISPVIGLVTASGSEHLSTGAFHAAGAALVLGVVSAVAVLAVVSDVAVGDVAVLPPAGVVAGVVADDAVVAAVVEAVVLAVVAAGGVVVTAFLELLLQPTTANRPTAASAA